MAALCSTTRRPSLRQQSCLRRARRPDRPALPQARRRHQLQDAGGSAAFLVAPVSAAGLPAVRLLGRTPARAQRRQRAPPAAASRPSGGRPRGGPQACGAVASRGKRGNGQGVSLWSSRSCGTKGRYCRSRPTGPPQIVCHAAKCHLRETFVVVRDFSGTLLD